MQAELYLGLVNTKDSIRDSIHVPIIHMFLGEDWMSPGQKVKLKFQSKDTVISCSDYYNPNEYIGIIDPNIDANRYRLKKGDKVLIQLRPNLINGISHVWTCPAIDAPPVEYSESEQWIREFAEKWNFHYDTLIKEASGPSGSYITARGIDLHSRKELEGEDELFWHHLENLTGKVFDNEHKSNFTWSCTC